MANGAVVFGHARVATVQFDGAIIVYDGLPLGGGDPSPELDDIRRWLLHTLTLGRTLQLDLGGHGDLCVLYALFGGARLLTYAPGRTVRVERDVPVMTWARLDADAAADEMTVDELVADLMRALGVSPMRRS